MDIRQLRNSVRSGAWVLAPEAKVTARTEFQQRRLTLAVATARLYLGGAYTMEAIARTLGGVTAERAAQVVRVGVNYMQSAGWLKQADAPRPSPMP